MLALRYRRVNLRNLPSGATDARAIATKRFSHDQAGA